MTREEMENALELFKIAYKSAHTEAELPKKVSCGTQIYILVFKAKRDDVYTSKDYVVTLDSSHNCFRIEAYLPRLRAELGVFELPFEYGDKPTYDKGRLY